MTQTTHDLGHMLAPPAVIPADGNGAPGTARVTAARLPLAAHATLERLVLGGSLAWVVLFTFLRWPAPLREGYYSNSSIDAAFFAFSGDALRQGLAPYVGFWDHKPPLIFLIDAAALSLSGGRSWGPWLFTVVAISLAIVLLHLAVRRAFGRVAATIGTGIFAFSLLPSLPFNLTEGYALPIQGALVLLLASWAPEARGTFTRGVALGVLGSLAFLLRANLIGAALAVALVMSVVLFARRDLGAWGRMVAGGVAGVALVAAPLLLWLARAGALEAFVDQAFAYNFAYAETTWLARARVAFHGIVSTGEFTTVVIPVAAWVVAMHAVVRWWHRGMEPDRLVLMAIAWLPLEVALSSASGRPYMHYFALLVPPIALLAAYLASRIQAYAISLLPGARRVPWTRRGVAVVLLGIALPPIGHTTLYVRDNGFHNERNEQVLRTAAWVREHTSADDRLLVWGHAADLHLYAQRRPASHYVYALPLLTPGYADSAMIHAFVDSLRAAPPALIVDATPHAPGGDALVPPLGTFDPTWRYPSEGLVYWRMTPALRAFYDWVAASYVVSDSIGKRKWAVYRHRGAPGDVAASREGARP